MKKAVLLCKVPTENRFASACSVLNPGTALPSDEIISDTSALEALFSMRFEQYLSGE